MKSTFCPKCSTQLIISESLENIKIIKCPECKLSFENPHYYKKEKASNFLDSNTLSQKFGKNNYKILVISVAIVILFSIINRNTKFDTTVEEYSFITKPGCYATYDKETYETFIQNYAYNEEMAKEMLLSGKVIILKNYTEANKLEKEGILTKIIAKGETTEMWVSDGQLINKYETKFYRIDNHCISSNN